MLILFAVESLAGIRVLITKIVDRLDVPARAKRSVVMRPLDNAVDMRILGPGMKTRIHLADHLQRQRVERLRPVQDDNPGAVVLAADDFAGPVVRLGGLR